MRRKRASALRLSRIYRGCKARRVRSENSHRKLDALPARRYERSFKKIAILRFSSLGDIVLTSPLLTTYRNQFPETEIVYVTKKSFAGILAEDPRIDRLIQIESTTSLSSLIAELRAEGVDAILDLHGKLEDSPYDYATFHAKHRGPKTHTGATIPGAKYADTL